MGMVRACAVSANVKVAKENLVSVKPRWASPGDAVQGCRRSIGGQGAQRGARETTSRLVGCDASKAWPKSRYCSFTTASITDP